ncbi:GNAT family N-acetyltransferase [Flavobacterium cerinum]|uniref:N-acetyltransferase n=1 Tax=Flavobacterium cerinum TaxID=2502784 RepID=A0A3S3U310_9FLAO|nr:GNAT family N-acetyltransferase [Flavobacterium cerinum]RWX03704.1 N-acetyltransferase [Flavobacterium cerinum]
MNIPRFSPFPILSTERLILRKITLDDDKAIYLQRSNEIVNKYIARTPPADITEAQAWITRINKSIDEGQNVNWAITSKNCGTFIGLICLWNFSEDRTIAETGYELNPGYHGKGYMNEALNSVINFGFSSLKLSMIEAYTQKGNVNSIKLLTKNGFVHDPSRIDEGFPLNTIYTLSNK